MLALRDYRSMTVADLLSIFKNVNFGSASSIEVTRLCFDSRLIETGCVFVAIRGGKVDGHGFLKEAESKQAAAVVVDDASLVPVHFRGAVAVVPETRDALNKLAARFFGEPANSLFCVGVTGTNGKTTTTYMIEAIFERAGRSARFRSDFSILKSSALRRLHLKFQVMRFGRREWIKFHLTWLSLQISRATIWITTKT